MSEWCTRIVKEASPERYANGPDLVMREAVSVMMYRPDRPLGPLPPLHVLYEAHDPK